MSFISEWMFDQTLIYEEKCSMAYDPKVNECFAFLKKEGSHPKAPDFKGTITITEPGTYDIACWKGEVGKEKKYRGLSIKLQPPFKRDVPPVSTTPPPTGPDGKAMPW